jgi:hypothetical protein
MVQEQGERGPQVKKDSKQVIIVAIPGKQEAKEWIKLLDDKPAPAATGQWSITGASGIR